MDTDIDESERVIATLLREDLGYFEDESAAESLQLLQALADSLVLAGNTTFNVEDLKREVVATRPPSPEKDQAMALRLYAGDLTANEDEILARTLQADDRNIAASQQLAQKLAAEERKMQLDIEYARRLQQMIDENGFDDESEVLKSVEGVLRNDDIDEILAQDSNSKGKGRKQESTADHQSHARPHAPVEKTTTPSTSYNSYHQCGICQEPIIKTLNPFKASQTPTSSSRLTYGLSLECPGKHTYCLDCVTQYIRGKLEEAGQNGDGSVFPIRCPECPIGVWQMGDHIAERILGGELLEKWHLQKIVDSLPRRYCPNQKCSMRLEVEEDLDVPQAECPACHILMCVPCRSVWHGGLTCEQFQDLPEGERAPEDRAVIELAKSERWRRCPSCHAIIELSHGCNHMTCICKHEFCHRCGADWKGRCTRQPPCELWDEDMLYAEQERQRVAVAERHGGVPAQVLVRAGGGVFHNPVPAAAPRVIPAQGETFATGRGAAFANNPNPARYRGWVTEELDWLSDQHVVSTRHWFTSDMIRNLTCGYCQVRLNSLQDLRYHLTHTRRHPVYTCCGKFFKREQDYQRHEASNIYYHDHTMVREDTDGYWG
ncbi:hypothetical protein FRC02_010386 [Tulasnella sp. 418]|nr:hypothetical protein FRC02_010386 [Tulasnella sp. 418]